MNLRNLQSVLFNEFVVVYMENNGNLQEIYTNLYKGSSNDIPDNLLDMKVRLIFPESKNKRGTLSICVI